ncbi:EI24 domain-containing protein [Phormidium tenue FACHB-886]|nr:EI24 domain-containing protein [Phormidium tenue FACHB-886]
MTPKPSFHSPQPIDRGLSSLFTGASYPLRALRLFLTTPKLRGYILLPILINVILGFVIYTGLFLAGMEAIDRIIADVPNWTASLPHWSVHLPAWNVSAPRWLPALPSLPSLPHIALPNWNLTLPGWFHLPSWQPVLPDWIAFIPTGAARVLIWLLRLVLTVVLLLLTGFIFLQFGVLLGAPWYGKLSEELERMRMGKVTLIEVGMVQDISRAILYELKKLGLTIAILVPSLLLNFFPGVGTAIGSVLGVALGATIVCMDFLDAAVERRRPAFREKLGIVWKSLPASGTFGLVCLALVSIPLVNLLAVPICVAAGTLFFCDRILPWYERQEEGS